VLSEELKCEKQYEMTRIRNLYNGHEKYAQIISLLFGDNKNISANA